MRKIIIKPRILKLIFIGIYFSVFVFIVLAGISIIFKQTSGTNWWEVGFSITIALILSIYCIAEATLKIRLTPTALIYSNIFGETMVNLSSITKVSKSSSRVGRILNINYSDKHKSISQLSFSRKQLKFIEKYLLNHCPQLSIDKK